MKILVTGLCTLHWGRLEYGNIGNYYIIEPTFRQLHRVFPDAEILTTFQLTEEFCLRENVRVLPMEWYYSWCKEDVLNALQDFGAAELYAQTKQLVSPSDFLSTVKECDLVLNISGEMWGDYADPVGPNRFLVSLLRDRAAQLMGVPVVLFAGSQGPFSDDTTLALSKIVYRDYRAVMAREPFTIEKTKQYGFDMKNTNLYSCPAFLFESESEKSAQVIMENEGITNPDDRPLIGLSICGFNFLEQPYDKWPREDREYIPWAQLAEHLSINYNAWIVLISHTNGFDLPPQFQLKPGRDYHILRRLYEIILKREVITENDIICVENPYLPAQTKALIGKMDMMVSGRAHAAIAAVSQHVPTVFLVYNEKLDSSKTIGFARLAGMESYTAHSEDLAGILKVCDKCWQEHRQIRKELSVKIPELQEAATHAFDDLLPLTQTHERTPHA